MFSTIVELLARQTCVIIPQLGGFVVNDCAAKVVDGKFFPPRKELVFNPKLIHNDGDLAHALMRRNGGSFDEVNRSIERTVESVWNSVKNDGIYVVPSFGVFTMKSGKISFQQKDLKVDFDDTFGLDEFYFPMLDKKILKREATAQGSSSSVKNFMIGAAAVLAFLLVGQPVKDSSRPNMASLAPLMVDQSALSHELEVKKMELSQLKSELTSYKEADADFYMIVAEFDNEVDANDFVQSAPQANLSLLSLKDRYYATAFSAKSKDEVVTYYDSVASNTWKDAYMLSVSKFNDELKNDTDIR